MDSGAPDRQLVRVVIFQQPYTLRATGDPGETELLAETVDSLMNQIATRSASADSTRVAVLAALHLADRLRQLERDISALQSRAERASLRLEELLGE